MQRDGVPFPEALKMLAAKAGVELDERTPPRGHPQGAPARGDGGGDRLLPRGPDAARRPASRRSTTSAAAASPTRRSSPHQLGWAPAGWDTLSRQLAGAAPDPARRARRGGPDEPAAERPRRLRPVPRAGHLPDPRRERQPDRPRRARSSAPRASADEPRPRPQVPQLAGHAAVRQEPDALPHRQGQGPDPARPARPSSSRATPTR